MRSAEVQNAIDKGATRLQRYVIPDRFEAWKLVVWWRKRKVTKYYQVKTRLSLKAKKSVETMVPFVATKLLDQHDNLQTITSQVERRRSTLNLESYYVTTLHSPRACDVKKSRHVGEECEEMTTTVKQLIELYGLGLGQSLEEFVFGLVKSVDGLWYFLNCNRGRTADSEEVATGKEVARTRRYKKLSFEELTERIYNHKQIDELPRIRPPEPNVRSLPSTSKGLFPSIPFSISMQTLPSHTRYHSHDYVVDHIDAVASRMDHLRLQSQILKKTFKSKQTGKLSGYSSTVLSRVIRKMYEAVMRDSRLARFFPNRERVQTQVAAAVQRVLAQGGSRLTIRKIHQHMNIEDSDFDRYVGYFLSAMEGEGVGEEDLATTQNALEDFRVDVVARKDSN